MSVVPEEVTHRRPHPRSMAGPFLECDLSRELDELHREPEWQSGQNAKTLVKYEDFRIVLTVLKAHKKVAGHQTEGRVSIQGISGHVLLRAEGRTFDLVAGRVVTFDRGVFHELEAIDDSAILQTIAWPGPNDATVHEPKR